MSATPYPGLRPFKEDETLLFFGQDVPLADLRERLYEQRFVAILGLSGCGKSSLLYAGLLADIRHKKIEGPRARWLIGSLRPGSDPLQNLVDAVMGVEAQIAAQNERLKEESKEQAFDTPADIVRDGYGLARFGHRAARHPKQRILIVVDQFEELFRYQREAPADKTLADRSPAEEMPKSEMPSYREKDLAALFVRLLIEAVRDQDCGVSVVVTMRSEFIGDCSLFFGLAELFNEGTFLLPRLSRSQIEEAITGPAEECGFKVDPSVVQEMLNETEQQEDGLPLLQHALRRVWERPRQTSGIISVTDFHSFEVPAPPAVLNIKHHLDDHLDSIYRSLGEERKDVTKLLFRLLSKHDFSGRLTRRPVPFLDVVTVIGSERAQDIEAVIEAFRDEDIGCTFLTPPKETHPGKKNEGPLEKAIIDVSHECLLRRWDRLGRWIELEERDAEQFRRLASDADQADLRALEMLKPRDPLSGPNLERYLHWWEEAELIGAGWALRYQGKWHPLLGRPALSFAAAHEYLEWSQRKAAGALAEVEASKLRAADALAEVETNKLRAAEALAEVEAGKRRAAEALAEVEVGKRRATLWRAAALTMAFAGLALSIFLWKAAESKSLAEQAAAQVSLRQAAEAQAKVEAGNANELRVTAEQLQIAKTQLAAKNVQLNLANKSLENQASKLKEQIVQLDSAQTAKLKADKDAFDSANTAAKVNAQLAANEARQKESEQQRAEQQAEQQFQEIVGQTPDWDRHTALHNLSQLASLVEQPQFADFGERVIPALGRSFVLTLVRDNEKGQGSPVLQALPKKQGSGIRTISLGDKITLPYSGGKGIIHNASPNPKHPGYAVQGGTGGWVVFEYENGYQGEQESANDNGGPIKWKRHFFPLTGFGYSTDGEWIASASAAADIRLIRSSAVSVSSLSLIRRSWNIFLLSLNSSKLVGDLFSYRYKGDYAIRELAISLPPDAIAQKRIAQRKELTVYGLTDGGQFLIWKHPGPLGTQITSINTKHPGNQWVIKLNVPNARAAALATQPTSQDVWLGYSDGNLADLTKDKSCPTMRQPYGISILAWDVEAQRLAIGLSTGTVRVFERLDSKDECDLRLLLEIPAHASAVTSLLWQDKLLITGSTDGSARSWDLALSARQREILKQVEDEKQFANANDAKDRRKRITDLLSNLKELPGVADPSGPVAPK